MAANPAAAWFRARNRPAFLDPARPWTVRHLGDGLTVAAVSIAWLAGLGDAGQTALARRHLAADDRRFRAGLRIRKRRVEWLAGRLAVVHAVGAHERRLGLEATPIPDVRVRRVADGPRAGKPYLDQPFEIGISHAGDFAVAACGPHPLGIDLEPVREMSPYLNDLLAVPAARRGDAAGRRLGTMPPALRWACREAVLKYYGVGLRLGGVRQVELTGWHPGGRFGWRAGAVLRDHCAASADPPPRHSLAQVIDGYTMAVVWR